MMYIYIVLGVFLTQLLRFATAGIDCYSCTNATHMATCKSVTTCPTGSVCHAEYTTVGGVRRFSLGCKSSTTCSLGPSATPGTSAIIGRSVQSSCSECCLTGLCNRALCQNEYSSCADTTDCSKIGEISNICGDVDHIKNVCRRFCGLCSLVDGVWSGWTSWSSCSVTCGDGTATRIRKCNNPAPANGGKACIGNSQESQKCTFGSVCAVSGGWSQWGTWGGCSASCDIGLQTRDRGCSNPAPSGGGAYCAGGATENRLCYPGPCADGEWSSWGNWDSCTVTCDGGLRTRTRTCDNPAPSLTGRYCVGDHKQSAICNRGACASSISFSAHGLYRTTFIIGDHIVYKTTLLNVGGGYDSSTGYFTAPVNGTYLLTVHVCSETGQWFEVQVILNGIEIATANDYDKEANGSCTSGTGIAVMKQGDKAWVQCVYGCYAIERYDSLEWNSFSGVLVGP